MSVMGLVAFNSVLGGLSSRSECLEAAVEVLGLGFRVSAAGSRVWGVYRVWV